MGSTHKEPRMARKTTGPIYFLSKGGYYVTINGKRHCLAKGPKNDEETFEKAETAYLKLKLAARSGEIKDFDDQPCFHVLKLYIEWFAKNRAERTTKNRGSHIQWFSDRFGHVECRKLNRDH